MTGLAGFAWLLHTMITGEKIKFYNETIQYQLPILIMVVIIKYFILLWNGFKTVKGLFKFNIYAYIVFVVVVLVIDYYKIWFDSIAATVPS
jgi:hypothetical protein